MNSDLKGLAARSSEAAPSWLELAPGAVYATNFAGTCEWRTTVSINSDGSWTWAARRLAQQSRAGICETKEAAMRAAEQAARTLP